MDIRIFWRFLHFFKLYLKSIRDICENCKIWQGQVNYLVGLTDAILKSDILLHGAINYFTKDDTCASDRILYGAM
jgi:hypothetical protein